tara:strand:- start:1292 stop:2389 length:1098 start_codon:yes stop_codon:yes gene_type:complete
MSQQTQQISVLLGTKAEMIKLVPVLNELERREIHYRLIETGQHGAYLSKLHKEFGIRDPDVSLGKGQDVDTIYEAFKWFSGLASYFFKSKKLSRQIFGSDKGICLIHGDTPSTLVGALMAKRAGIKIAHLESGLRSGSFWHPFPEELIRVVVMKLADVLFAPDKHSFENLISLKVKGQIEQTLANTGVEALQNNLQEVSQGHGPVIATLHRVENLHNKKRLLGFLETLEIIAKKGQEVLFVIHQPTAEVILRHGGRERFESAGIMTTDLIPYKQFVEKLARAPFVLTDGGSIQEETTQLGVPCLLWRDRTEREDGIGENVLLSHYELEIIKAFLDNTESYRRAPKVSDFRPSVHVVDTLEKFVSS